MAITTNPTLASKPSAKSSSRVHMIGIAAIKVVKAPERVRTVLGSCIGLALYDRISKVGGMAHVILPDSSEGSGDPGKFADSAVDILLDGLLQAGAVKERVAAKICGGAAMFGAVDIMGLGARNAESVIERLRHHGIRVAADALGGTKGRKMMLDPGTGAVVVEIIGEVAQTI